MSAELTESSPPVAPVARPRRWHLWPRSLREWAVRLASVVVVLAVWQLYAPHVNPIFLRPPSQVVAAFIKLASDGVLLTATLESVHNLLIGFLLALVFGLAIGLASARSWLTYNAVNPWLTALYSTPSVALVPFMSLWLGIGDSAKVAVIALFSVFPILVNTQQGVRYVDPGLLEVARSFNSSERRLWRDVLLPAALPFIFAGIKLAVPRALVGMVLAEFLISVGGGLGSLIIVYQNTFRVDRMFVPVIVVAFMGVVMIGIVQWLESRLAPWARRDR
ncbi:MAG TPA: ABC transporter permease [Candidatus Dormibacteraeota bacterium]|nr:ABC transporter permease [Candidatus Dormibacteraeota bacterium]